MGFLFHGELDIVVGCVLMGWLVFGVWIRDMSVFYSFLGGFDERMRSTWFLGWTMMKAVFHRFSSSSHPVSWVARPKGVVEADGNADFHGFDTMVIRG